MQSILLHIQDDEDLDQRVDAAITLAAAFDGHITCLHATPYAEYLATDPFLATVLPIDFSTRMEELQVKLQQRVEARLKAEAARWDWIHVDDVVKLALVRKASLTDVVVMSLGSSRTTRSTVAAVTIGARCPVLAIPSSVQRFDFTGHAAVAWDGSVESSVALRASLPFLRRAASVHLIEIEERTGRMHGERGARYLTRHGIEAVVVHRTSDGGEAGTAINEVVEEIGATLLVMGAYGHSRAAEFLLGGATKSLMSSSRIPLLLAH